MKASARAVIGLIALAAPRGVPSAVDPYAHGVTRPDQLLSVRDIKMLLQTKKYQCPFWAALGKKNANPTLTPSALGLARNREPPIRFTDRL